MVSKRRFMRSILSILTVTSAAVLFSGTFMYSTVLAHDGEEDGHLIPHEVGKLEITGGITSVLQGTSGLNAGGDVTDFSYTFDLSLEAPVGNSGKVVIALEAGNGNGVNDNMPSLSISNYDPYITEAGGIVTPSVSQAYYEGSYYDGVLGVKAGKLDVHSCHDDNAFANDETDQFLTGMFVRSAGSVFPELDDYYAPGIILTLSPLNIIDITVACANGSGTGLEDVFSNAYTAGQVNVKPNILGKEGNYRFYYIYDARNYTDISDTTKTRETNTGFGISLDQKLSEGIGIFARYASQDDGINENLVTSSISGGLSLGGSIWNRADDVIGVAYGILNVNDKSSLAATNPDDETHLEVYYKFGFSDHFTLTPDLQVVTNAGGDASQDTITVYGVRAQMNF